MLRRYKPTLGGGTCERDFGNGLVDHWRKQKRTYCAPRSDGSNPARPPSKIDCYLVKQTSHHGSGDNLCVGENVRVSFADLADGKTPQAYFKRYVDSKHQQQHSKIAYRKGTLAADCTTDKEVWQSKHFPGWNVNWFNAFEQTDDLQCDVWDCVWEENPTLIVERDTFANFFHNSEDFVNTLIALAILEWSTDDLQLLFTDLCPKGPFWPIWSQVFKGRREPLTAWDIAQKYGDKRVCFKKVGIAILGAASPITVASFNTKCKASSIVRAYSDYVVRGLGFAPESRYASTQDPKSVVVTFMARRSSGEWPEKRFCDSARSFFDCAKLGHLGIRKLGRSVRNDGEVVRALKSLEGRAFPNGARVTVRDVDYSSLSFEDQIKTNLDTDVMVGPHGAGLMHNIFMPDRAALVELFIDGSSANRHFHNLANWQGRQYHSASLANPVPTGQLLSLVAAAISALDLSKPY
ncbi:hypothetical protein JL721_4375 [Aureococcus anophagefferens]|nr:hypothetical protein JL721_4375 [Aureococcus anophagefferens]